MTKRVLPYTIGFLFVFSGCYINRALYDPYSTAPATAYKTWSPSKSAERDRKKSKLPIEPTIPAQEEPLSLAEIIDVALRNNTSTQITWAQARSAAAHYGQTQATDLPDVNADFSFIRTRTPGITAGELTASPVSGGTGTNGVAQSLTTGNTSSAVQFISVWGPQATLSYTLLDFGVARATSEAARQSLYFADWTHNRNIQTVIQTIATDYYNYIYQSQLLAAYATDVATAQVTLNSASYGLESGVKDVTDVLQARTQLLQNQINWINQQQAVKDAYATLLNDMGIPANINFNVLGMPPIDPSQEMIQTVDELIAIAIQERADVLAAQSDVRSKEQLLIAAKREYWPKLNTDLQFGRTYFNGGINDDYDWLYSFDLSMPIFSGFYYRNNVKMAKANKEQAEAELQQKELTMIKEITTSHYQVKVAFEALEYAEDFFQAAEKQYTVSLSQYKEGTNSILDVVSAQSALANARATKVKANQQWFTSLTNLAYATGILAAPQSKEEMQ